MEESFGFMGNDKETIAIVKRYENMLLFNKVGFFDVEEFDGIIDYYRFSGYPKKALEASEQAVLQHPNSMEIKLKRAFVLHENGKQIDALRLLTQIQKIESSNSEVFILKGSVYLAIKQIEQAKRSFDIAIKLELEDKANVCFSIAESLVHYGHYKIALEFYFKVLQINPDFFEVYYEMASVNEQLGDYDQAEKDLQTFLDFNPFAIEGWYHLAMLFNSIERYDEAIEAMDFAIAIDDADITMYFVKAGILTDIERFDDALAVYDEVFEIEELNPEALIGKGEIYERQNKFSEAMQCFDKALEFDEEMDDAWHGKAVVAYQTADYEKAVEYISKALKLFPENADFWFTNGKIATKMNNENLAIHAFIEATSLDPEDEEAWLSYADSLVHFNLIEKAIQVLENALGVLANNPHLFLKRSILFFKNMNFTMGFGELDSALKINPKLVSVFFDEYPEGKNIPGIDDFIKSVKTNNK